MIDLRTFSLNTTRLHLRPLDAADAPAVARITSECFGPMHEADAAAYIAETTARLHIAQRLWQPPYGDFAITHAGAPGTPIGLIGLVPSLAPFALLPGWGPAAGPANRFVPAVGLFWAVGMAERGHGIATEAARAFIAWAFEALRIARVVATTEHDNAASLGVMRALGMTTAAHHGEPAWFQQAGWLDAGERA